MNTEATDKERIFLDVLCKMKEHTWRSLTQVCGAFDDRSGELLGTGTFVEYRGNIYLLSAEHVAGHLSDSNIDGSRRYGGGLCHSVGNGQQMMHVTKPWTALPLPEDLAVTRIDPIVLDGTDRSPVSSDLLAADTRSLDNDIYYIHGFPGKRSRFTTFGPGVVSTSLPYGGWLTTAKWGRFDNGIHFAITYPRQEIIDEQRQATDLPDPGGLSGSMVWKANRLTAGENWKPEQARVVGVAHRFDQESQCLIVTRIEYVHGLLMYVVRAE